MASDTHLARLKEGAAAWNRWRQAEPLVRPNLQGLSLTPAQKQWGETSGGPINFAQSMLREADLRYATLIDADLAGASLMGADLSGARLRNADLRNANLSHSRLDDADLTGAQFAGADLSGADLSRARNLRSSQIAAAGGDAKTLLPPQIVAPLAWRNDAVIEPRVPVSAKTLKATAEAYVPTIGRSGDPLSEPQEDPFVDRFGKALRGLPRPRLDAVAGQVRRALKGQPGPRLDAVADRTKRAFKKLPRLRLGAVAGWVRDRTKRAKLALGGLLFPWVVAAVGAAALLVVLGFGGMLALRALDRNVDRNVDRTTVGTISRTVPPSPAAAATRALPEAEPVLIAPAPKLARAPRVVPEEPEPPQRLTVTEVEAPVAVAETQALPEAEPVLVAPAPKLARAPRVAPEEREPPQRLTVTEAEAPVAVEEVGRTSAARIEEERPRGLATEAIPVTAAPEGLSLDGVSGTQALAVEDLATQGADRAGDPLVRLAFAMHPDDGKGGPQDSKVAPVAGGSAQAPIESYVGQPVAAGRVQDTMKRIDLPKPTTLAKAHAPDDGVPEALQAARAPTSVVDYLSMPNKSSDWIRVFIKDFYLSGKALDDGDLRRIYSREVDYFGQGKTSLDKVAREKAQYYRLWPSRHYELVPGSLDIAWKSTEVADVSFTYQYKVSAPNAKTSKGRGRAHLTLDLRGHTGLIVREDGEVIAHN
ncbi:MAG TPA: pentapeptide repeat-containing protein [Hyphomicrobium sp.]